MVITALMIHRQRAIVRALESAGATSAGHAQTAQALGMKPGLAWHQLVSHAVLQCPGEGRYFIDLAQWQRLRQRRRLAGIYVGVALLIAVGVLVWRARGG